MKTSMDALRARMENLLSLTSIEDTDHGHAIHQYSILREPVIWALEEWRLSAIPEWRLKLKQSIEEQDQHGEAEARWMLAEILEDPDCTRADV